MTSKRAHGTKHTDGGLDKIHPVYREKFADLDKSRNFVERAWHLFLKKGDDCTNYPVLDETNSVTGHSNNPVSSKGAQKNSAACAEVNIDHLLEGEDDDGD